MKEFIHSVYSIKLKFPNDTYMLLGFTHYPEKFIAKYVATRENVYSKLRSISPNTWIVEHENYTDLVKFFVKELVLEEELILNLEGDTKYQF